MQTVHTHSHTHSLSHTYTCHMHIERVSSSSCRNCISSQSNRQSLFPLFDIVHCCCWFYNAAFTLRSNPKLNQCHMLMQAIIQQPIRFNPTQSNPTQLNSTELNPKEMIWYKSWFCFPRQTSGRWDAKVKVMSQKVQFIIHITWTNKNKWKESEKNVITIRHENKAKLKSLFCTWPDNGTLRNWNNKILYVCVCVFLFPLFVLHLALNCWQIDSTIRLEIYCCYSTVSTREKNSSWRVH